MDDRESDMRLLIELMARVEEGSEQGKALRRDLGRFEKTLAGWRLTKWRQLRERMRDHQARVSRRVFLMGMAYEREGKRKRTEA